MILHKEKKNKIKEAKEKKKDDLKTRVLDQVDYCAIMTYHHTKRETWYLRMSCRFRNWSKADINKPSTFLAMTPSSTHPTNQPTNQTHSCYTPNFSMCFCFSNLPLFCQYTNFASDQIVQQETLIPRKVSDFIVSVNHLRLI